MKRQFNENNFKLENLGIDGNMFEKYFVISSNKIRKVYSDSAVQEIDPSNVLQTKRCRENEDIYDGIDNEYNPYEEKTLEDNYQLEEHDSETISDYSDFDEERKRSPEENNKNEGFSNNTYNIFGNCSQNQIEKLNRLVGHHQKEAKVIVKAYRSKLKSKHHEIYKKNSQEFTEKIKHKIFHKCNFPGCSRTFASAGWLKSHFSEHDKEILDFKFNKLFENYMRLKP